MNKVKNTKRIFINTLNANDEFTLPGESTIYVCESRRTEKPYTTVTYRVKGTDIRYAYTRPGLSTVDLVLV